jgi:hypothetical protein
LVCAAPKTPIVTEGGDTIEKIIISARVLLSY